MKTEELIEALAADTRLNPPRMTVRLLAGLVASVVLVALFWSVRPDLPEILSDPLVAAKFALPLGLALLIILLWPEPGSGRAGAASTAPRTGPNRPAESNCVPSDVDPSDIAQILQTSDTFFGESVGRTLSVTASWACAGMTSNPLKSDGFL